MNGKKQFKLEELQAISFALEKDFVIAIKDVEENS